MCIIRCNILTFWSYFPKGPKLVAVDYALTREEGGALNSDLKGVYAGNLCFCS